MGNRYAVARRYVRRLSSSNMYGVKSSRRTASRERVLLRSLKQRPEPCRGKGLKLGCCVRVANPEDVVPDGFVLRDINDGALRVFARLLRGEAFCKDRRGHVEDELVDVEVDMVDVLRERVFSK